MTPIDLVDCLADWIADKTRDMKLQVRVRGTDPKEEKERAAAVFKLGLPNREDATAKIPYILLKFLTAKDDKPERQPEESMCQIRIIVATYSEDGGTGEYDVLNVLLRIRSELEKAGMIAERYALRMPLEYTVYQDNTRPYYLGEMITNWSIPAIKREVEEVWL